jgi:uncharacterized protein YdeI (YjbR/CyaY-like superfamily)
MNPKVDAFINRASIWQEEMEKLRTILLDCGLTEEIKWGKPCYAYQGSNIVVMQPFKAYFALLFFKGYLLKDPEGILVKTGENTHVGRQIRFTGVKEISKLQKTVKAYIYEAIEAEKAGGSIKEKKKPELKLPEEFTAKLGKSAALKKAFYALTPGRQRAYSLFFSGAKQAQTREARIEKCVRQILAGKGINDL